ncbi:MAG: hypothetical protein HY870_23325 [Chloroflexi bacterium]|nr:hypothetical protein [Chloroflexota bacterium]
MSPDLEWRVDDPTGEQTIAKTSAPRPPRWRKWAIGLVVMLGIGSGVIYRSIPEPARPAPTPTVLPSLTPTAMPAALYTTIAREAQALATGDRVTLAQVTDIQDFNRYQALVGKYEAWGQPTDAALYAILDFRLTAADKAWVEIKQFHTDRYEQEIRFYHLRDSQWRRTDFDPAFWSGLTETSDTPHFRFTYFIEDYALIEPIAAVLEADYERICTDFACQTTLETCVEALDRQWCSTFPREITVTFGMTDRLDQVNYDVAENGDLIVTMPSLRTLDQLAPMYQEDLLRNAIAWLHVGRLAYGATDFQGKAALGNGRALVIAIFFREYNQLLKRTGNELLDQSVEFKQLDARNLPPLDDVWSAQAGALNKPQIYAMANAVVEYIEHEFGWQSVVKLLKAIGPSKSLAEAIETSTGISYVAFEERWQAWVVSNTSTTP